MYVKITYGDIMDAGMWDLYCEESGTNPWALNEGLASLDDEADNVPKNVLRKMMNLEEGQENSYDGDKENCQ